MKKLFALFLVSGFGALSWQSADAKNLFINSTEYAVDTLTHKHYIGPGTTYARYRVPDRPMDFFVFEIDLSNPYICMETWNGGDAAVGGERPTSVFARKDAPGRRSVAAHNGDFYTTINGEAGISRMGLYSAGECIFNATGNPLLVVSGDNVPVVDHVNFSGSVKRPDGAVTRLHTVNQLRLEWESSTFANQLSLYTPAFGEKTHSVSSGGNIAVISPKGGTATFPANTSLIYVIDNVGENPGNVEIPENGAVLHGVGSSADFLGGLKAGDEIELYLGTSLPSFPDITSIREAIGGSGHIILRNGEIQNINNADLHPRTFMGISKDRTMLYSVVVDGRTTASAGIDLDDEGRLLQWLGAWEGINLDGGGSSSIVVDGQQMNHPSDGAERAVGNGVLFYSTAPDDEEIASIAFEPRTYNVPVTAKFRPAIYGYNKYGFLESRSLENVTLTCDPEVGSINSRGEFVAAANATHGKIYAKFADGVTAEQEVFTIVSPLSLDYDTYVIDDRKPYPIRMSAPLGRFTYDVDPAVITWTGADPDIAVYSEGYVQGGSVNGTTTLNGTNAAFTGSITLHNESVSGDSYPLEPDRDLSKWSLKQTGGTGITIKPLGETGWELDYTGNGTSRGAGITMKNGDKFKTFGLPHSLSLSINPGAAPINEITITYTNNQGKRGSFYFLNGQKLTPDTDNVITTSLDGMVDVNDNTCYPLTFTQIKLDMGVSTKGQAYNIKVNDARFIYDVPEGITSPVATDGGETLTLVRRGDLIFAEGAEEGLLSVYDMTGRLCASAPAAEGIDVSGLEKGIYLVRAGESAAKFIAD